MLKSVFLGWMEHSWRRLILEDARDHISHLGRRANPTVDPFVNTALILTLSVCVFFCFLFLTFVFQPASTWGHSLISPAVFSLLLLFLSNSQMAHVYATTWTDTSPSPPSCALCSAKINTRRPALPNMKTHTLPVVDI